MNKGEGLTVVVGSSSSSYFFWVRSFTTTFMVAAIIKKGKEEGKEGKEGKEQGFHEESSESAKTNKPKETASGFEEREGVLVAGCRFCRKRGQREGRRGKEDVEGTKRSRKTHLRFFFPPFLPRKVLCRVSFPVSPCHHKYGFFFVSFILQLSPYQKHKQRTTKQTKQSNTQRTQLKAAIRRRATLCSAKGKREGRREKRRGGKGMPDVSFSSLFIPHRTLI